MKYLCSALIMSLTLGTAAQAASYSLIDPNDRFFINDWGSQNRYVVVVRKLGSGQVKVRDLRTGEPYVVHASQLLTRNELEAEELGNAVVGTAVGAAIVFCLFAPENCN